MKPKISIITLGVEDLTRARKFYEEGLGLVPMSYSSESIAFYDMNGVVLSLYPKDALAEDVTISQQGSGFSGVTIAHNEPSKEKVDEMIEEARAAGATIVKESRDVFWGGYSGYFQDLDGHLWEVAYNPYMDLT
ncbi:MAG: VOC family protein [Candidatus Spechtbacteria bacterium SB0662_bin_43]|uniref:VOC family protein n=1 Tax=Candidatus Spechtbacteria bacterium SB0662_bin_43 TaxID=2604897 RepID=A0A845DBA5_9BACT|nr:VOC family protein [Candidatus Spechtbacteria bacterium SB0662_bin_43]